MICFGSGLCPATLNIKTNNKDYLVFRMFLKTSVFFFYSSINSQNLKVLYGKINSKSRLFYKRRKNYAQYGRPWRICIHNSIIALNTFLLNHFISYWPYLWNMVQAKTHNFKDLKKKELLNQIFILTRFYPQNSSEFHLFAHVNFGL